MIVILGFALGAIVGSFLATLILRWPEGRGVVAGRSQCDGCGRTLGARDLVPLLSALAAKGKCRECGATIAPLHWQVEALAGLVGAGAVAIDPGPTGWALALMGWLLIPLALLDWRHHWLPDRLNLALAIAGLAVGGYASGMGIETRLIGGLAGFGVLFAIATAYKALRGHEGMGGGDPKLLGALGCWLGWQALPVVLLIAAGTSLGLIVIAGTHGEKGRAYPFGTALAVSGATVAVALNTIV